MQMPQIVSTGKWWHLLTFIHKNNSLNFKDLIPTKYKVEKGEKTIINWHATYLCLQYQMRIIAHLPSGDKM